MSNYTPTEADLFTAYEYFIKERVNTKYDESGREPVSEDEIREEFDRGISEIKQSRKPLNGYESYEQRQRIKDHLLDSLTSHVGCGSDLKTGENDEEWLEILEGNLDVEHLVSDVQTLIAQEAV